MAVSALADGTPVSGGDRQGSPVHDMQARLEAAVFASFSAKKKTPARRPQLGRAMALVAGGSLTGYALFATGFLLHLY